MGKNGEGGVFMTIGQLGHLAMLHAQNACTAPDRRMRIELFHLAYEAARKDEAIARWRGENVGPVATFATRGIKSATHLNKETLCHAGTAEQNRERIFCL